MQFQITGSRISIIFINRFTDKNWTVTGINLLGERLIFFPFRSYILRYISHRFSTMNKCDRSRRHMVRWKNCVRLEGVYLMRKYSHCPILKKCIIFVISFTLFYRIARRSTFWHLVHFGSEAKQYFFDGCAWKWRHGRFYWWYFFQRWSIDIWTQIRRSFELNINCTPFTMTISMCVPIGAVFWYFQDSMINRLTKA